MIMMTQVAVVFAFACFSLVEGFAAPKSSSILSLRLPPSSSTNHRAILQSQRRGVILNLAPDGMSWFVKTETFCKPFPVVKPHLEAHRAWVQSLREQNGDTQQTIVSGYRVDAEDRPGGGGLMIFAAENYAAAEEFIRTDPLIANECVDWQLNKWIAETGDISIE